MFLFDDSLQIAEKALNFRALKTKVLANNIANVDTPFYKRKDVIFEKEFEKKLKLLKTHPRHLPKNFIFLKPKIVEIPNINMRNDLNNVDIDKELVELTKNTMLFKALSQALILKFQIIENIIKEGKL